jgi:Glycosyl hydrolase family 10
LRTARASNPCRPWRSRIFKITFRVVFRLDAVGIHGHWLTMIGFWGSLDGRSWLTDFPVKGRTNHPQLLDRQNQPKPALDTVINALRARRNGFRDIPGAKRPEPSPDASAVAVVALIMLSLRESFPDCELTARICRSSSAGRHNAGEKQEQQTGETKDI